MQQSYRAFLTALTESKAGQTYESLQWAGESLLSLGASKEAENVLRRVLDEAISNPGFLNQAGGQERRAADQAQARRGPAQPGAEDSKKLDEAASLVEELLAQYPRYIEPLVEKGMLLEAQAEAGQGEVVRGLRPLGRARPEALADAGRGPLPYYDAWYHVA